MEKASPKNNYHYNKSLLKFARYNRKNLTKSAACMWKYVLNKRRMLGYQFRRERPILNFIADFVCLELLLIIEVDGVTHYNKKSQDLKRDKILTKVGFTVLRFNSLDVLNNINEVYQEIYDWILENENK